MSSVMYDRLKWVAVVGLPATGTLWFTIATIFGLPLANEILGTIVAVDTFMGVLLGVSTKKYNESDARFDGSIIATGGEAELPEIAINLPVEEVIKQGVITLKVVSS